MLPKRKCTRLNHQEQNDFVLYSLEYNRVKLIWFVYVL